MWEYIYKAYLNGFMNSLSDYCSRMIIYLYWLIQVCRFWIRLFRLRKMLSFPELALFWVTNSTGGENVLNIVESNDRQDCFYHNMASLFLQSTKKSSLLTAAKKAKLKSNPNRVRFSENVTVTMVNGAPLLNVSFLYIATVKCYRYSLRKCKSNPPLAFYLNFCFNSHQENVVSIILNTSPWIFPLKRTYVIEVMIISLSIQTHDICIKWK